MKKIKNLFILWMLGCLGGLASEPVVTITDATGEQELLTQRVKDWIVDRTRLPTIVTNRAPVEGTRPIAISIETSNHQKVALLHTNDLYIINLNVIQTNDTEVMARRVERLAMRSVGQAFGITNCPNPRCCLFQYKNLKQLDQIARDMCPPHAYMIFDKAKEEGITLIQPKIPEQILEQLKQTPKPNAVPITTNKPEKVNHVGP